MPFDLLFIGGVFEVFDHAVVADGGGVHDFDAGAFAKLGDHFLRSSSGGVVGDGGVETEAEVGLDFERGGVGAAEADFFLDGENGVEVVAGFAAFKFAECFEEDENGDAVVEGFDVDAVAHFNEVAFTGDGVTDFDEFFDGFFVHAEVDEVVGELGWLGAFLGRHDVNGFGSHDADEVFFTVDDDALAGEGLGIETAEGVEADEAFIIDVGDDEADLVHVGGGHGFLLRGLSFFESDDIADGVDADVICEFVVLELLENEVADGFFKSWRAGGFANFF